METPSSTRIVTRSQASSNISSNIFPVSRMIEDSEKNHSISNGCALIDITNDSPIVGLANGGNLVTPLSSMAKQRGSRMKKTPGSGEALLRGQVNNLLQKVEEESVFSKISLESSSFLQLINSTQISNLSGGDFVSVTPSTNVQEQLIPQVLNPMYDGKKNVNDEDDDASVWSMQVNASTHDEDYDVDNVEEIAENEDEEYYYDDVEEEEEEEEGDVEDGGLLLDELCQGLNNISVNERVGPKFEGRHTRFVYNSDDEIVKEEEVENSGATSSNGKHLSFSEEE
ncbi:hypothetical protein TanjilG_22040 [Lupinus angustifolius]|uniref:Uncharacterized protein n=1 Tax=Lupinus angustifolius TaxID=3871 RepID=A0A4P1QTM7_LUPAN|nr:PREDICTED: uncharacterized protein LOC109330715 isoform X1 [Lupinus angustifolius]OIV94843.1 hypothetical protein TanjilG_22040 [Lupinus angustifolius]